MSHEHLLGRQFVHGSADCYGLVRDYFKDVHGIELTDYARPEWWWESKDLNLIMENIEKEGFRILDIPNPRDLEPSDVIVMAIGHTKPNHLGIYLGNGNMLHHLTGRMSRVDRYAGVWRSRTIGQYRFNSEVIKTKNQRSVGVMEFLPVNLRQRLRDVGTPIESSDGEQPA